MPEETNGSSKAASDIDTRTVTVTFFKNKAAATLRVEDVTLRQLADRIASQTAADKARLPLLKLARFGTKRTDRNCLRHDANVTEFGGVEAEHDAGTMTFEAALETMRAANIRSLLYTSPSYVPEERERWRILLPLSKSYSPEKRADFVAWVNGLFGGAIASESFTLSQAFYYGHIGGWPYRIEITDGEFVDMRDDLEAGAIGRPVKGAKGGKKNGNARFTNTDAFEDIAPNDPRLAGLAAKWIEMGRDGTGMEGYKKADGSIDRSAAMMAFVTACVRAGITDEVIAACLMRWKIGEHIREQHNVTRALNRAINDARQFVANSQDSRPVVKCGALSKMADRAAEILLAAEVPFYQRGNKLVRPVVLPVETFGGKITSAAQLVEVDIHYLRDTLCRKSRWMKLDKRSEEWVDIHPPHDAAMVLLKRFGDWAFPVIAGIITTPTLRPDGTVLSEAGYDPATKLLLVDPPPMPPIPENPTKNDAIAALNFLKELLAEFPFVDDVSRSVALSAQISTVCRGAYPIVPVHVVDAPLAGSGKSYLLSTVSWIATGEAMPVIGTGKNEEELEKRLGAAVIQGQALVCIDNVVGELGGQAICQLVEQLRPKVRVLGLSQLVEVEARSVTYFANGNNIIIVGDMYRRVVRCRLDPGMERPELRAFATNPMEKILANRGAYIAAALTICRAYIAAGRPNLKPRLNSYGEWSDTVRSALTWLGEADPVDSMDTSRAEDPEATALLAVLNEWRDVFGTGDKNGVTLRAVIERCERTFNGASSADYVRPALRDAVLSVMPTHQRHKPTLDGLGYWMRGQKDRRVAGMWFNKKPSTGHSPTIWWVEHK